MLLCSFLAPIRCINFSANDDNSNFKQGNNGQKLIDTR